ncbi:hypothetical protein [Rhizobium sp. C1]|uniref:hypothetical protein n=1 Tax=Rhizobium sp. C1 TaxID=1349799 RepID=UPI001E2BA713|nr:hypothetical protein [Rhizobium sp. C1]MCD2178236.1 hypothetical protein [Rhizobium sp. C1]
MTEDIRNDRATAKAKGAAAPVSKSDTAWIDQLGLNEDQGGLLADVTGKLQALNKRSTAHAFDIGHEFHRAKSILPPKSFGRWLKPAAGYTVKAANLYISIHEQLGDYKERLISATVAPTTMFVMARGNQTSIETALKAFESGEKPTGRQVQAIIDAENGLTKKDLKPILLNAPGLAGLRKAAAAKELKEISLFHAMIASIRDEVESALKPLEVGRAVIKKHLSDKVAMDCRHAHDLLCSIAVPVVPGFQSFDRWRHGEFERGTAWHKVQVLLYKAGAPDAWPDRAELVGWLQNEMLPVLRFILDGEPLPGFDLIEDESVEETESQEEPGGSSVDDAGRTQIASLPSMDIDLGFETDQARALFDALALADVPELA